MNEDGEFFTMFLDEVALEGEFVIEGHQLHFGAVAFLTVTESEVAFDDLIGDGPGCFRVIVAGPDAGKIGALVVADPEGFTDDFGFDF